MDSQKPLVSVYCLTYNHAKYIRDCLDGFIMQQTDFPFEVIVHDDASTDGTPDIIREYQEKYPDIIKPIYQTVNQYQQHTPILRQYIFPMVRGKYIAICEGDDYWTDPFKLREQVKLMEQHPECHFAVCGVQEVMLNKKALNAVHPSVEIKSSIIEPKAFIQLASTYSFQTSSYLMRYDDWKVYLDNPPEFKKVSDIGDLPMLLYYGSLGKTAYVNKVMSCYRRGAPTSYSTEKNNWPIEKRVAHFEKQMKVWKYFDAFSNRQFHDICTKKTAQNMFGYCILRCEAAQFFRKENREYLAAFEFRKRIYLRFACLFKETMKKQYLSSMRKKEEQQQRLWESDS